ISTVAEPWTIGPPFFVKSPCRAAGLPLIFWFPLLAYLFVLRRGAHGAKALRSFKQAVPVALWMVVAMPRSCARARGARFTDV
ncbi:hypothetical protein L0936_22355, partial [Paracidovorax citrulli]